MNTWSYCSQSKLDVKVKKCACIDGFSANSEKKCKPNQPFCPSFILENDTVISQNPINTIPQPCQTGFILDREGKKVPSTNCTKSSDFCFIHSNAFTEDGLPFGHCCPKPADPKVKLSIGCPTTDTTCLTCPYLNNPGNCPKSSHNCYSDIPNSQIKSCCPISCRGNTFKIAGTGLCFKKKSYDDECTYDVECPDDASCERVRARRFGPPTRRMACQKRRMTPH